MLLMTHCDSGEQTLGHVGDNDTDEENDGIQPVVAQDEGDKEEGYTKEHSHPRDDVDEMLDLPGDRGLTHLESGGQVGNTAHDGSVTGTDDHAAAGT